MIWDSPGGRNWSGEGHGKYVSVVFPVEAVAVELVAAVVLNVFVIVWDSARVVVGP